MEYSKNKENSPKQTIKLIKKILNNYGIRTKINWCKQPKPLYSCRLHIGKNMGTNGKGTTKEYALASAYSELMERLQNGFMFFSPQLIDKKDKKLFSASDFLNNSPELINKDFFRLISNYPYTVDNQNMFNYEQKMNEWLEFLYNDSGEKFNCVEFFHVNTKTQKYIPENICKWMYSSSGMSAGNSAEEAIVQGLSEIMERYCAVQICNNNYVMPIIDENIYLKYSTINKLYSIFKKWDFEISLHDASLGKNYPVVCIIMYDKVNHKYAVNFGAHPVFPIAVERCFTELLQCFEFNYSSSIDKVTSRKFIPYNTKHNCDINKIYLTFTNGKYIFSNNMFYDNPSWDFNENTFFYDNIDNKKLLKTTVDNLINNKNDIYVRNSNFMGFPSFYIVVPQMPQQIDNFAKYDHKQVKFLRNNIEDIKNYNPEQILSMIKLNRELIDLVEYMLQKDYLNSKRILNYAIENYDNNIKEKLICLKQIIELLEDNYSLEEIEKILKHFYEISFIKSILGYIKNPISLIIENTNQNIQNKRQEVLSGFLNNLYNKNIPSQDIFLDVFNI